MSDSKTQAEPKAMGAKLIIYWDDQHIDQEAQLFPKYLQESYRRVKIMCREQFSQDMNLVTEAFAKVGVKRDKTTWTRIFKRGRWNTDAAGNELPSPIVNLKKLAEEFEAFITQTRVELQRGKVPHAETTVFQLIRRFVEKKMRPEWVNKFGVIIGPTGLQKSASFKELAARDTNIKHLECVDNASSGHLITLLAYKYGVSVNRSSTEKRFKIYENFGPGKCIVLDNTQDLNKNRAENDELQKTLRFLRWLQDERGGTIINSITPESEDGIFPKDSIFMEQFEGRAGGKESFLRLPDQNPRADFVTIATSLGMEDAGQHAKRLEEIGTLRGRIRTFYNVLQEAKRAAAADNSAFTIEYIEAEMEERASVIPIKKEAK